ncbi:hypothetical protein GGR55DRAFT_293963 [Xylaria sp. FL0064]|nr:hypothetical protein GGR55DRAFT_293963 [Xylaria sp. FL0064]
MPARRRPRGQQEQPQMFHLFGQLPTELRLKIWTHSWAPRTVSLYLVDADHFLRPGDRNLLPASGYVNSESRSETLRHYKRSFVHPDKTGFRWFNFDLDILCLATSWPFLDDLDPRDLRQVQRLIIPETLPGTRAVTPCETTWPEPVTESFKSPKVEQLLMEKYPNLREITLTTNRWHVYKQVSSESRVENCYLFQRGLSLFKGWGHMRTTYISGLKVRHSPTGSKTNRQRYCCRLSEEDVDFLVQVIIRLLV